LAPHKIIHLDLDAFFCAVEELRDPSLRGKAFAVGGKPGERGVVASCSYAARQYGVHSAMPTARALRLCPQLIVISPEHHHYGESSSRVMDILHQVTPLLEQVSVDEAFLDVSDLPQEGKELAESIQERIFRETGLPCSLGVASNKLVAKIANNFGKEGHKGITPPKAITVIKPGEEASFLAPLPVKKLWGVGPKTADSLNEMGIQTIGELASYPELKLAQRFGKAGFSLSRHARGIDDSPIETTRETKSISQEITFSRDISDIKVLEKSLLGMSDRVGRSLREEKLCASTVRIKIRWPDFSTHTRQISFRQLVDQDSIIYEAARQLLRSIWQPGKKVRLLGVGVSGLKSEVRQLSLWDAPGERERRLLEAVDMLRERFGKNAIKRGTFVKKG
jgi:DNA polymerase IV